MDATPPTALAVSVLLPAVLALLAIWAYLALAAARELVQRLTRR
jgi:hypothetical protein